MCGIAGIISEKIDKSALEVMSRMLSHRGPDAEGFFNEAGIAFVHRRLSIIDLSEAANQPFYSADGKWVIIFNGEIYNFKEIKCSLEKQGYFFRTNSDTEVIIAAFEEFGVEALRHFIGMFAFALYNRRSKEVYLVRDRLGVKPLYYTFENGILFASELKALYPIIEKKELNTEAVREYFRFGYITGEKTILESVRKLPAGSYLYYKDGKAEIHNYWSLNSALPDRTLTEEEWQQKLHDVMINAFKLRMVADVPVGVFLSGGIDSSLVTAILQQHHGNIHTFTIGFDDERFNEAPFAKQVATYLGTRHTEFELNATEAYKLLENFYDIYDEPFADSSGIPTSLVSRLAAQQGIKVVLSADGGDELFAGYTHYPKTLYRWKKIKRIPAKKLVGSFFSGLYRSGLFRNIYSSNAEHRLASIGEILKSKQIGTLFTSTVANQADSELSKLLPGTKVSPAHFFEAEEQLASLQLWDLNLYLTDDLLVKMDRATMYNSIEGREPFLDHRLVELAFKMPEDMKFRNGKGKYLPRKILSQYIPRELFERPKKGFSIPIFKWFSSELQHMFNYYLEPNKISKVEVLDLKEVLHEVKKYNYYRQRGREYNMEKMWRILSFLMWWNKWYEPLN